jgi:membrane-associated phospholipid phosphatase
MALTFALAGPSSLLGQRDGSVFARALSRPDTAGLLRVSDIAYGSVILIGLLRLEPIDDLDAYVTDEFSRDSSRSGARFGWGGREIGSGGVSFALAAGPLVYGLAAGDSKARRLGLHSLESLYAAAILARLMKTAVGRARPNYTSDPDVFEPFNSDAAFHSYPSGHTTRVFALAATFAQELGDEAPWVPWVAYSVAVWTGASRVVDRAHWLTDVTAGAALGILTARFVERLNHRGSQQRPAASIEFFPLPGAGVAVGVRIALGRP